ncbi:zwei Ig domain protein zig-8 [Agrilus planipennis]|uniref:Zwei Ig domain protein zig-8 n=1 Tax=Agrilus planipennis TaxID=224129 RepID=A0A1W4W3H7_AGRPL|nr:zwei Ig domain protein zig-8 [Agrilus planipennis]
MAKKISIGGFPAPFPILALLLINLVSITSLTYSDVYRNGRLRRSYGSGKGGTKYFENLLEKNSVFATENSTVVYAQRGGTATLPCVIRKNGNGMVSWVRKGENPALLTYGLATYSADERFMVEHVRHLQNWGLLIKKVQQSDAGVYECQVSTHPPVSIFIKLRVTEATANILGTRDVFLNAGSALRLICTLKHSIEPPEYVFWYQNNHMVNYNPGVEVKDTKTSSVLLVKDADTTHSGNYTCSPSNAVPASVNVHVLNATEEENPAAMLHAGSTPVWIHLPLAPPFCLILITEALRR